MATTSQLLLLLNPGRENGTGVKQLAAALSAKERHVRQLISDLREDGQPICGTPQDGYFLAETAEELTETCDFLRSRAMHSLSLESKLRKIPLANLIGQIGQLNLSI
jgi:biotin operon repressor